jgi:large subunit ribosomal protein L29
MDLKELRQKAEGELQKLLAQHREELRDLRFKINSKQHKDVRDIRSTKKLIARILTVLKEKHVLKTFTKQPGKEIIKPAV